MRSEHSARIGFACVGLLAQVCCEVAPETSQAAEKMFVGYYQSWDARASGTRNLDEALAQLPPAVNIVNLAFMRPDARYSEGLNLSGVGLEFEYPGAVLKNSIRALKERSPGTRVLVSVGGEVYNNWAQLNAAAIARFVRDFMLDGVDIDFEPAQPGCKQRGGRITCLADSLLLKSVEALRSALPKSAVVSLTATATAAFGEGKWRDAKPRGGPANGMLLGFFNRPYASEQIDFINIMAYDAGRDYNPLEGLEAFQHYFKGPILIGFTPPPEAWGNHFYSEREVVYILRASLQRGAAGAMLFSLQEKAKKGGLCRFVKTISATLAVDQPE